MSVHVLALLKGAVEGDAAAHFRSMVGMRDHHTEAVRLGLIGPLVTWDDMNMLVPVTDRGRRFYIDANLASLPAGAANYWGSAADRALAMLDRIDFQGTA